MQPAARLDMLNAFVSYDAVMRADNGTAVILGNCVVSVSAWSRCSRRTSRSLMVVFIASKPESSRRRESTGRGRSSGSRMEL